MTTFDDGERTVIKGVHDPGGTHRLGLPGEYADALPAATRLHEFEILSVIGQGGFGIVYLAHDLTLDRRVAIKEYMPSALATRTQAMTVAVRSTRHTETFAAGLRSFINEARLLARFDHPSLLKVHRFWEAHGTAYMVMPYYAGITLAKLLAQAGGPPDEARLRALLDPLLDALDLMHSAHCYHRDIAPDNILILPDGRPLLLDFGAARRVIGDMTQTLTVILKTGYAPVEQYGELPDMAQGAWTDLYALGSVLQFAITGHTPPQAVARFIADKREPLAIAAAGRYSDVFLRAVDRSLAVLPKDRPQSVAELRALLGDGPRSTPPHDVDATAWPPAAASTVAMPTSTVAVHAGEHPSRNAHSFATVWRTLAPSAPTSTPATRTTQPSRSSAAPRLGLRAVALGSVALLAALAAAGLTWFGAQRHAPADAAPASDIRAPAVTPAAPATLATPAPPTLESTSPATPAPSLPDPQPEPQAEAAAPARVDSDRPESQSAPAPVADAPRTLVAPPSPRATRAPTSEARSAQRIPNKKLSSARCADIIQRASLGEELSEAEKTFLKQECGQ
jgi:serine/threonine protein kinase